MDDESRLRGAWIASYWIVDRMALDVLMVLLWVVRGSWIALCWIVDRMALDVLMVLLWI